MKVLKFLIWLLFVILIFIGIGAMETPQFIFDIISYHHSFWSNLGKAMYMGDDSPLSIQQTFSTYWLAPVSEISVIFMVVFGTIHKIISHRKQLKLKKAEEDAEILKKEQQEAAAVEEEQQAEKLPKIIEGLEPIKAHDREYFLFDDGLFRYKEKDDDFWHVVALFLLLEWLLNNDDIELANEHAVYYMSTYGAEFMPFSCEVEAVAVSELVVAGSLAEENVSSEAVIAAESDDIVGACMAAEILEEINPLDDLDIDDDDNNSQFYW